MKTDETQGEYNIDELRKEKAVLRQYAALQAASEDKIGCQKIYVDIAGGIEEAFVLDELIFFTLPKNNGKSSLRVWKNGILWLAVRRSEWWDRKRLTARQSDNAIQNLIKRNLVFKDIFKFNGQPTVHIRLNVKEFFRRYTEVLEKANPPENEDDTLAKDINDLYAMMGVLQNPNLQNGETKLQNGETPLQNGNFLNNPHTTSTNHKASPLSEKDLQQANAMVDAIIANSGKHWQGREIFQPDHLPLVDWYHEVTGQVCRKIVRNSWMRAVADWAANNLTPDDLQAAYDADIEWRGVFTSPMQLTEKAIALRAQRAVKSDAKTTSDIPLPRIGVE